MLFYLNRSTVCCNLKEGQSYIWIECLSVPDTALQKSAMAYFMPKPASYCSFCKRKHIHWKKYQKMVGIMNTRYVLGQRDQFFILFGLFSLFPLQSQDNCWIKLYNLQICKLCSLCFNSINTEIAIQCKILNIILTCGLARLFCIPMSIK